MGNAYEQLGLHSLVILGLPLLLEAGVVGQRELQKSARGQKE